MNDDPGPARHSRRRVLAPIIAVASAAAVLVVGWVVICTKDSPQVIEDRKIIRVIVRQCDIMTETVKSMPITGTPAEQAAVIRDQDKAVTNMLSEIRKVDFDVRRADPPTNSWLADWQTLVASRERFAEQRRNGYDAAFRVPRSPSGDRIDKRIDQVRLSGATCEVPDALNNPYPADVSAA